MLEPESGWFGNGGGGMLRARAGAILSGMLVMAGLMPAMAGSAAAAPAFRAYGSAGQVYVLGLRPGARMSLVTPSGHALSTRGADSRGGLLFRGVPPGRGYRVRLRSDGAESGPVTVHSDRAAPWDPGIYRQPVPDSGYSYLATRDGTKLAVDVHLPASPAAAPGPPGGAKLPEGSGGRPPYPTVIEYSGYGYADPAGPENGIAVLANLMGFAVVDVNMRGTGCSGGAFDFFEPLQSLDAYDVIETIAHQPWVLGHKVGMIGVSYGAISQLFAAQLDPPDLEAIAPLSTFDAAATTLYAGGILNTGFAVPWARQRQHDAEPAGPGSGQPWAYQQIKHGDRTCAANQVLHGEAANLMAKIAANHYYSPSAADQLDPVTFVSKIKVPVFMACQWEDEQTGGHCADLAQHFTGTRLKWFTFTNGAHIDSIDPDTYDRWYDFLQLFVARKAPIKNVAVTDAAAPVIYQSAMGLPGTDAVTLPPDPIQKLPTYKLALAAFEKLPKIRILFENGAGASPAGSRIAGNPYPAFERDFSSFPVPRTIAQRWYLGSRGTLHSVPPATRGTDWYTSSAGALPPTDFGSNTGSGGLWGSASQWKWKWKHNPAGTAVSYISPPLRKDTTVIGAGAVYAWVRSSAPDVRSPGHHQRGAAGRQRNIRAERLDPRQRAQACHRHRRPVQAAQHAARPDSELPGIRRAANAQESFRRGSDPALLRRAHLPGRLAHPGDDLRTQRHAASMVLRPDRAAVGNLNGLDRLLQVDAIDARAPGHPARARADVAAPMPEPAQRAVPAIRADGQPDGQPVTRPRGHHPRQRPVAGQVAEDDLAVGGRAGGHRRFLACQPTRGAQRSRSENMIHAQPEKRGLQRRGSGGLAAGRSGPGPGTVAHQTAPHAGADARAEPGDSASAGPELGWRRCAAGLW